MKPNCWNIPLHHTTSQDWSSRMYFPFGRQFTGINNLECAELHWSSSSFFFIHIYLFRSHLPVAFFAPHVVKSIKRSISVVVLFFSFSIQWREISSLTVDYTSTIYWPGAPQYLKITCSAIQENRFLPN